MELGSIRLRSGFGALRLAPDVEFLRRKKTAMTGLRWPLVIATTALLLGGADTWLSVAIAAALLLSNVVVRQLPDHTLAAPNADVAMIVVDTVLLTVGFSVAGGFGSGFFVAYFFVIFLAGISDSFASVVLGSLLASLAYLGADLQLGASLPRGMLALRILFLFSVAVCYGGLVERARREQEQRRNDETARLESALAEMQGSIDLHDASTRAALGDIRASVGALIGYLDLTRQTAIQPGGGGAAYLDKAARRAERIRHFAERELERLSMREPVDSHPAPRGRDEMPALESGEQATTIGQSDRRALEVAMTPPLILRSEQN